MLTFAVLKSTESPGRRHASPRRSAKKLHREALVKAADPEAAFAELKCSNPREGGVSDPAIQQTNDEAPKCTLLDQALC